MKIELREITKRFGPVTANDAITLTVEGGQIIGVLGENGAGKSTLMKIVSGYQPADSGRRIAGNYSGVAATALRRTTISVRARPAARPSR